MELIRNSYEQYILLTQNDLQREISTEVIVPDTQPDVFSVLTAFGVCQLRQKVQRNDWLTVEGVVEVDALCQEEDSAHWQRIRGSIPFSQEIEVPGCREDSAVILRAELLRCDAQIRNPRKLHLQAQLDFRSSVYRKEPFEVTESASGSEEEGLQLLRETADREILYAVCEKKLNASDEMMIEPVGKLLYHTVDWQQEEQRILSGKVMLRGNIELKTVYFNEGEARSLQHRVPFSQVIECEGLEPGDLVTVDYQTLQSQITQEDSETPMLSCSISGIASVTASKKMSFPMLRDLYSTHYETECRCEPLDNPVWQIVQHGFPAEEAFQPEEPAERVLDCSCRVRGVADEQGRMGGVYNFRILYRSASGEIRCAEHTVRVTDREPAQLEQLTVRAFCRQAEAKAENGGIALRFAAVLQGRGIQTQPCMQVTECTLNGEKLRHTSKAGSLVLRTVQPGETVWSIAKQYGTRMQKITDANHLESGEKMRSGVLLMIPFSD